MVFIPAHRHRIFLDFEWMTLENSLFFLDHSCLELYSIVSFQANSWNYQCLQSWGSGLESFNWLFLLLSGSWAPPHCQHLRQPSLPLHFIFLTNSSLSWSFRSKRTATFPSTFWPLVSGSPLWGPSVLSWHSISLQAQLYAFQMLFHRQFNQNIHYEKLWTYIYCSVTQMFPLLWKIIILIIIIL